MQKREKIIRICASVLFMAAIAALSSAFIDTAGEWYVNLIKPVLIPPSMVLSVTWTALYILIAISLFLCSINPQTSKQTYFLYLLNSVLIVLWLYIFFLRQNPSNALVILIALTSTAVLLFANVFRFCKSAAYLLIPYIIWLCLTLYLNYEIAFFN